MIARRLTQQEKLLAEIENGDRAAVEELLSAGGVNLNPPAGLLYDKKLNQPLLAAAYHGHAEIVHVLIERGADVNQATAGGRTALMQAADRNHIEVARVLLEHGADVNARDRSEGTALHDAALRGHVDVIRLLLQNGADRKLKDFRKKTANAVARENQHDDAADMLLLLYHQNAAAPSIPSPSALTSIETPAEGDRDETHALLEAIRSKRLRDVQRLVAGGADLNPAPGDSLSHPSQPLLLAVDGGHLEIVRFLLDSGADVNQVDANGEVALHRAARARHVRIVALLCQRDASINHQDVDGLTALHKAVASDDRRLIRVLLSCGADRSIEDNNFRTAEDMARAEGKDAVADLIRDYVHELGAS